MYSQLFTTNIQKDNSLCIVITVTSVIHSSTLFFFQNVNQLVIDISLQKISKGLSAGTIRFYYSELLRIHSYGFDLYQSVTLGDVLKQGQHNTFHRLNYVRTRSPLGRN